MTIDHFIKELHAHLAALESPVWPEPHNASNGPALFLDAADTRELIELLERLGGEAPTAKRPTVQVG
jgi:hypothetical protein